MKSTPTILGIIFSLLLISCEEATPDRAAGEGNTSLTTSLMQYSPLTSKVHAPNWVWIDVRKPAEYASGHIPGAIQMYRADYTSKDFAYKGMKIDREAMAHMLGQKGIRSSDTLVVYDAHGNVDASRVWWLLTQYGHPHVVLLNGGLTAWVQHGGILDTASAQLSPQIFRFTEQQDTTMGISMDDVIAALQDTNVIIVDTRSWEEFTGAMMKAGAVRAGHIPGSVWCDYIYTLQYTGDYTFKPKADLERLMAEKNITPDKTIITYCHTGVRSALMLFVLQEILDYPSVYNYDGSWVEWSHHDTLPVAIVDTLQS